MPLSHTRTLSYCRCLLLLSFSSWLLPVRASSSSVSVGLGAACGLSLFIPFLLLFFIAIYAVRWRGTEKTNPSSITISDRPVRLSATATAAARAIELQQTQPHSIVNPNDATATYKVADEYEHHFQYPHHVAQYGHGEEGSEMGQQQQQAETIDNNEEYKETDYAVDPVGPVSHVLTVDAVGAADTVDRWRGPVVECALVALHAAAIGLLVAALLAGALVNVGNSAASASTRMGLWQTWPAGGSAALNDFACSLGLLSDQLACWAHSATGYFAVFSYSLVLLAAIGVWDSSRLLMAALWMRSFAIGRQRERRAFYEAIACVCSWSALIAFTMGTVWVERENSLHVTLNAAYYLLLASSSLSTALLLLSRIRTRWPANRVAANGAGAIVKEKRAVFYYSSLLVIVLVALTVGGALCACQAMNVFQWADVKGTLMPSGSLAAAAASSSSPSSPAPGPGPGSLPSPSSPLSGSTASGPSSSLNNSIPIVGPGPADPAIATRIFASTSLNSTNSTTLFPGDSVVVAFSNTFALSAQRSALDQAVRSGLVRVNLSLALASAVDSFWFNSSSADPLLPFIDSFTSLNPLMLRAGLYYCNWTVPLKLRPGVYALALSLGAFDSAIAGKLNITLQVASSLELSAAAQGWFDSLAFSDPASVQTVLADSFAPLTATMNASLAASIPSIDPLVLAALNLTLPIIDLSAAFASASANISALYGCSSSVGDSPCAFSPQDRAAFVAMTAEFSRALQQELARQLVEWDSALKKLNSALLVISGWSLGNITSMGLPSRRLLQNSDSPSPADVDQARHKLWATQFLVLLISSSVSGTVAGLCAANKFPIAIAASSICAAVAGPVFVVLFHTLRHHVLDWPDGMTWTDALTAFVANEAVAMLPPPAHGSSRAWKSINGWVDDRTLYMSCDSPQSLKLWLYRQKPSLVGTTKLLFPSLVQSCHDKWGAFKSLAAYAPSWSGLAALVAAVDARLLADAMSDINRPVRADIGSWATVSVVQEIIYNGGGATPCHGTWDNYVCDCAAIPSAAVSWTGIISPMLRVSITPKTGPAVALTVKYYTSIRAGCGPGTVSVSVCAFRVIGGYLPSYHITLPALMPLAQFALRSMRTGQVVFTSSLVDTAGGNDGGTCPSSWSPYVIMALKGVSVSAAVANMCDSYSIDLVDAQIKAGDAIDSYNLGVGINGCKNSFTDNTYPSTNSKGLTVATAAC